MDIRYLYLNIRFVIDIVITNLFFVINSLGRASGLPSHNYACISVTFIQVPGWDGEVH